MCFASMDTGCTPIFLVTSVVNTLYSKKLKQVAGRVVVWISFSIALHNWSDHRSTGTFQILVQRNNLFNEVVVWPKKGYVVCIEIKTQKSSLLRQKRHWPNSFSWNMCLCSFPNNTFANPMKGCKTQCIPWSPEVFNSPLGWPILHFFNFSLLPKAFLVPFDVRIRKMQKNCQKIDV